MSTCILNSNLNNISDTSSKCKIDCGIHMNFNSINKWDTYKLKNYHITTFIEKISTITYEEEHSIIEVIKTKIRGQKLIMREIIINKSKNTKSITELKIKTNLSPEEYYKKYIKEKITSNPSKNCFYAFSKCKKIN